MADSAIKTEEIWVADYFDPIAPASAQLKVHHFSWIGPRGLRFRLGRYFVVIGRAQ